MFLTKIDRSIAKVEAVILTLLLMSMILLSAYQVIARNWDLFHNFDFLKSTVDWLRLHVPPFVWGDAVVRNLVLWVGFVGASIAAQEGGHLAIDFVSHFTPQGFKKYSSFIISIASAIVCYFLMIAAYKFFQDEKLSESFLIPDLVPSYWAVAIIPFGFFMMTLRFSIKVLESIHAIFRNSGSKE